MKLEPPSILTQAKRQGWPCEFYDFRKAKSSDLTYFNPALIRRNDGLWLVTRRSVAADNFLFGFNSLMAFKLDENHSPQFGIPISVPHASSNEHFEDPRVCIGPDGRYFLSACNFIILDNYKHWTGAHQVLLEVNQEWETVKRYDPPFGKNGKNIRSNTGDEKNWLWFFHEGELHLIYMTDPHTVVRFDKNLVPLQTWTTHQLHPDWKHGHIRGGTAPVRIGDLYYSFFHSSLQWRSDGKRRYFMGAYAFEARPPFRMISMTTKPLLAGSQLDPWAEGKPLVVFPCSAILDTEYDDSRINPAKISLERAIRRERRVWTISLGVNDLVSAYVQIPHDDLLERLDTGVAFKPAEKAKTLLEAVFK